MVFKPQTSLLHSYTSTILSFKIYSTFKCLILICLQLSRNHEYSVLVQAVAKFNRELKLSSLQCKDRSQLSQQWEDQQFFRILVRMMHEVTT